MLNTEQYVPAVYTRESRDFQFFCKLLDLVVNSSKLSADKIADLFTPYSCPDRLLSLLASLYNYNARYDVNNEDLRAILSNYTYLLKNKGTAKGIEQAISIVLKMTGELQTAYTFGIMRFDANHSPIYKVSIAIQGSYNRRYLDEMLDLVLPVGFITEIYETSLETVKTRLDVITTTTVDTKTATAVSSVVDDELINTYRAEVLE